MSTIQKAAGLVDDAMTSARMASKALDVFDVLVVCGYLDNEDGNVDIDSFTVFLSGIRTQIDEASGFAQQAFDTLRGFGRS